MGKGNLRSAWEGTSYILPTTAWHPRWLLEVTAELHMWECQLYHVSKTRMPIFCFTRKQSQRNPERWVLLSWEGPEGWPTPLGPGQALQLWPKLDTGKRQPSTQRLVCYSLGHILPPGRATLNCYQDFRDFLTGWGLWICGFAAASAVPFPGERERTPGLDWIGQNCFLKLLEVLYLGNKSK